MVIVVHQLNPYKISAVPHHIVETYQIGTGSEDNTGMARNCLDDSSAKKGEGSRGGMGYLALVWKKLYRRLSVLHRYTCHVCARTCCAGTRGSSQDICNSYGDYRLGYFIGGNIPVPAATITLQDSVLGWGRHYVDETLNHLRHGATKIISFRLCKGNTPQGAWWN